MIRVKDSETTFEKKDNMENLGGVGMKLQKTIKGRLTIVLVMITSVILLVMSGVIELTAEGMMVQQQSVQVKNEAKGCA